MARELKDLTTEELLDRATSPATEEEFSEVVAILIFRYKALVYKVVLWRCRGNMSLADDAFQNTFLRLFTWLRQRRGQSPLHSFARLIQVFARRAAIDLMRRERLPEVPEAPSDEGRNLEDRLYVVELLEVLDERSRQVTYWTYFEGLSAPEIAQRLDLTPGNIRLIRFRALEKLKAVQARDSEVDSLEEV